MAEKSFLAPAVMLGDVMWDFQYWVEDFPQPGSEAPIYQAHQGIGGSAANTAVALQSQGFPCALAARLGDDDFGGKIRQILTDLAINLDCLQFGEKTGYTVTIIDQTGERTMLSQRGAAAVCLALNPELLAFLEKTPLLFLSGYYLLEQEQAQLALEAAALVKKSKGLVALDPSPLIGTVPEAVLEQILGLTDLVLPNQSELEILAQTSNVRVGLERLSKKVAAIGLKLGSKGSALVVKQGFPLPGKGFLRENITIFEPALPVEAIDTTGAGDAFNGSLLAAYLKGEPVENWLKQANYIASQVIRHKGAVAHFFTEV